MPMHRQWVRVVDTPMAIKWSEMRRELAYHAYSGGLPQKRIAEIMGASQTAVFHMIKKMRVRDSRLDVPIRQSTATFADQARIEDPDDVLQLYKGQWIVGGSLG